MSGRHLGFKARDPGLVLVSGNPNFMRASDLGIDVGGRVLEEPALLAEGGFRKSRWIFLRQCVGVA